LQDIVSTRFGEIEGDRDGRIRRFRGIPFAAPPVDALRFRAPVAPEPWAGVREATAFGPASPQIAGALHPIVRGVIGAFGQTQSQNCLYLNVWTPRCDDERRPVMVWIHGGAFVLGSGGGRVYDGARLAARGDVVVVTINYRLGALGFLDWKSVAGPGETPQVNLGIRDQIAALEWVRDNIEAFGGDPDNVTVFGESAGAMCTATLLGTPAARPLFHKAILQSGAAHNVSREEKAARAAHYFAEALGLDTLSLDRLQSLTVSEIMRAQSRTSARIGRDNGLMAWQPSVDRDLIPEQPLAALERGDAAQIPVLIGTNRDEIKLFTFASRERITDRDLAERIHRIAERCDYGEGDHASKLMATYGPRVGERATSALDQWVALQSDQIFHYPASRLADLHSRHQPQTFVYRFDWRPPVIGEALGSCHALDLPFVFGGLKDGFLRAGLLADRSALPLSEFIQDTWLSFAYTGSPVADASEEWPAYEEHRRYTKVLGSKRRLIKDPHGSARAFWGPLIPDGEAPLALASGER